MLDGYGKRVLVVDDDMHSQRLVSDCLDRAGYVVVTACDGEGALHEVRKRHFDVILTELVLPSMSGGELRRRVHQHFPNVQVIMMTNTGEQVAPSALTDHGPCLPKPMEVGRLLGAVFSASTALPLHA